MNVWNINHKSKPTQRARAPFLWWLHQIPEEKLCLTRACSFQAREYNGQWSKSKMIKRIILKFSVETEIASGQFQALPHLFTDLQIPPSLSVAVGSQTCPLNCFILRTCTCSYFTFSYILQLSFEWLPYNPEKQQKHPNDFPAASCTPQTSMLQIMLVFLHLSVHQAAEDSVQPYGHISNAPLLHYQDEIQY